MTPDPLRTELSLLIQSGMNGRSMTSLFHSMRARFAANRENLSWDSFSAWCNGTAFPSSQLRQNLLADEIGGADGDAIRRLAAPPFRYFRHKKMEADTMPRKRRIFPTVRRDYHDQPLVPQAEITCATCGHTNHYKRHGKVESDEYFRNRGWEVGTSAAHDYCPRCSEIRKGGRKVVHIMEHKKPTEVEPEPQREMTKEDGRLIYKHIEERWDDNAKHYLPGWSDQKLAELLSVPVEWVRQRREFDFGGVGEDPDIHELIERSLTLENRLSEHDQLIEKLTTSSASTDDLLAKARAAMHDTEASQRTTRTQIEAYKEKQRALRNDVKKLIELAEKLAGPFREAKAS